MNREQFIKALTEMNACDEAKAWVSESDKTPSKLWATCERGDWMLWLACRVGVGRKTLVLAVCDCTEAALDHLRDDQGETMIVALLVLHVAREWCDGRGDLDDVRAAASAAYAAASPTPPTQGAHRSRFRPMRFAPVFRGR